MTEITALIRFKNSAETLPKVLSALKKQSHPVAHILAVDTGSSDESKELLLAAGAHVISWNKAYHHSKVTNFGCKHCETSHILCLSSHTVMNDKSTVERLLNSMEKPDVVASSIRWDADPYYSDLIGQKEIVAKGMKFGSIYTNSLGLLRKARWEAYPFDESINGMEDYDWALHQLKEGYSVARIEADISYQRNAHNRDFRDTARAYFLANRYGLRVRWLGYKSSMIELIRYFPERLTGQQQAIETFNLHIRRLGGAIFWRFINLNIN